MKIIKLDDFDNFVGASALIANLLIQGKQKEAIELSKTSKYPKEINNMILFSKYKEFVRSVKKNKLKFTKKQIKKAEKGEKRLKKKLKLINK